MLIEKETLVNKFCDELCDNCRSAECREINPCPEVKLIMEAESVDYMTRAHWDREGNHIMCSNCFNIITVKDADDYTIPQKYCSRCGAKMVNADE